MGCESYQEHLMDAALGALAPERERELRAHAADCPACAAELERQQRLVAAMDRTLAAAVDEQPSPAFAARVRARIAEEEARRSVWQWRWWPAAAGALAVAMLVIWLLPRSSEAPQTVPPVVVVNTPPLNTAKPQPKAEGPAVKSERGSHRPQRALAPEGEGPKFPEVLVPEGEWKQVVKLYQLGQQGQASMEKLALVDTTPLEEKAQPLDIGRLKQIRPLGEEPQGGQSR